MKRRLAALAAAAVAFAAAPAAPVFTGSLIAPADAVAKTCSAGFKHAVINGAEKCLRCTKRDARGNYHLS
jgi:hypothetical protein